MKLHPRHNKVSELQHVIASAIHSTTEAGYDYTTCEIVAALAAETAAYARFTVDDERDDMDTKSPG